MNQYFYKQVLDLSLCGTKACFLFIGSRFTLATAVSQRLINFVLYMYHQLTSEQRSQIFALLQKKTKRKEIARIVGTSEATLSRELERNSTPSGKYIWTKAHDMAMQRRKRTVTNAKLPDELVWRIKEYIINDQWSPRQISGYLRKNEGIKVSRQSIYNIIHNARLGNLPSIQGIR